MDYILDTISVDWNKVDHIVSKQVFLVRTRDGSVYKGTLSTSSTGPPEPIHFQPFFQRRCQRLYKNPLSQKDLRWNNWYYTSVTDFLQSSVLGAMALGVIS